VAVRRLVEAIISTFSPSTTKRLESALRRGGKGMPAALLMSNLQAAVRGLSSLSIARIYSAAG